MEVVRPSCRELLVAGAVDRDDFFGRTGGDVGEAFEVLSTTSLIRLRPASGDMVGRLDGGTVLTALYGRGL